jgi:signal transduction histidine kinase
LNAWAEGRRADSLSRRFAVEDGLETSECSVNIQPVVCRGRDRRLWFATSKGVSVVDPGRLRTNSVPPSTVLEEVSIDGVPVFSNGPSAAGQREDREGIREVVVPPGRQRIEIRYTGLSLVAPERVRFRHRLEEAESAWEEAGTRRLATYHRLAPGRYHFQVSAANTDGIWDPQGAALHFRVLPAWWQTSPFRSGMVLSLMGLAWGAYRARVRAFTRARVLQEGFSRRLIASQESERQRIARELHDSLGQNLLVIKSRVALAQQQAGRPEKLADQLGEAAAMASNALREVREISQNLRPYQLDELGLTKAIGAMVRKLAAASPIRFTTDLAELCGALPPEFEINLYRIVQESLNNVVKHSGARECSVTVTRDEHRIVVRVADDGCGFEASGASDESRASEGFGLSSLRERARIMSAQVTFAARPGEGTCVTVSVPLRR